MANLKKKEQEYTKAARMRYEDNKNCKEIAKEFGYKPQTIRKWFSQGKIEDVKRKFSDQELYNLERAIENDIWDAEQEAKEALGKAKKNARSSSEYRQVAETMMKVRKQKIKMLQELGVIQKPKERREVENTGGEVVFEEEVVTERVSPEPEQEHGEEGEVAAE